MKYFIYGLYSTENNIIRYVGQTKSSLTQRKNEHKCDAINCLKKEKAVKGLNPRLI